MCRIIRAADPQEPGAVTALYRGARAFVGDNWVYGDVVQEFELFDDGQLACGSARKWVACGLAPHFVDGQYVVLAVLDERFLAATPGAVEAQQLAGQDVRKPRLLVVAPEGRRTCRVLREDVLSVRGFKHCKHSDFQLGHLPAEQRFLIACPGDLIFASKRTLTHRVEWFLSKNFFDEALRLVRTIPAGESYSGPSELRLSLKYIDHLLTGVYHLFLQLIPSIIHDIRGTLYSTQTDLSSFSPFPERIDTDSPNESAAKAAKLAHEVLTKIAVRTCSSDSYRRAPSAGAGQDTLTLEALRAEWTQVINRFKEARRLAHIVQFIPFFDPSLPQVLILFSSHPIAIVYSLYLNHCTCNQFSHILY